MIVNFLVPSTYYPMGGTTAPYEFANGLRRRGHDVHVTHVECFDERPSSVDELPWFDFEPGIRHHFPEQLTERDLPDADFVFCFDGWVPTDRGLPLTWLQAYKILEPAVEERIFVAPGPKICIARWLLDVLAEYGVPEAQRVHIPYGMKHEKYRIITPIEDRPPRIAMLYNSHPVKAATIGIDAIAAVLERIPEADAVMFGTTPLVNTLPDRVTYYDRPDQQVLVESIYNTSRVFVSSSSFEGFGLAALESMASGCALVTTANGGSSDYAMDGETALVAPRNDAATMAHHIEALLVDDATRVTLAHRGAAYSQRFQWDRSALLLEQFLESYRAEPSRYLAPPTGADAPCPSPYRSLGERALRRRR